MEKKAGVELLTEPAEGGLKELVLRWFTETQAPLILHNGNFPDWFQGLTARKDAEDLLRDKALGCFLIRLSDKAIGYILSYKGHDRCRHFVITQNPGGQFVISGDCQTYSSLSELIEHYKVSPIQPFGEYLTCSCNQVDSGELYDVVNYKVKEKSLVSVQALRSLWDHKPDDPPGSAGNQQSDPRTAPPPALPPKSRTRKLTGTVSVDGMTLSPGLPPVPKRGIPLSFSLSGSLPETSGGTQTDSGRAGRLRGSTNPELKSGRDADTNYPGDLFPAGIVYPDLTQVESRSRSLPRLDKNTEDEEEEEEYSNQLSSSAFTPPVKRVTCHTYSLHTPREGSRLSGTRSEQHSEDPDMLRSNPLYQSSQGPEESSAPQGDGTYAEVAQRPAPAGLPEDTYEQIPGEASAQSNTYESLEDMKTKKSKSTWGKNNINWKKFLPDYKKK